MNDMAKNLILWLIIAAVLVTVMNNFSSPNEPQTLNYSDFIQQVKDGKVERVAVDGYVITGKRNDGDSFKTIRPAIQDNGLIGDLVDNHVVIEGKQPEQQSIWTQLLVATSRCSCSSCARCLWQEQGAPAFRGSGENHPVRRRRLRRGQGRSG